MDNPPKFAKPRIIRIQDDPSMYYAIRVFVVTGLGVIAICQITEPLIVPSPLQRGILGMIVFTLSLLALTPARKRS